jgi:hypothetical protein
VNNPSSKALAWKTETDKNLGIEWFVYWIALPAVGIPWLGFFLECVCFTAIELQMSNYLSGGLLVNLFSKQVSM